MPPPRNFSSYLLSKFIPLFLALFCPFFREGLISEQEDQADNVDRFIRTVKKYLCLTELTPAILNDLVKAVYVHAPDKSSGHRVQDVDYIGIFPASLLNDLINGNAA